jgi:hypothetical protein
MRPTRRSAAASSFEGRARRRLDAADAGPDPAPAPPVKGEQRPRGRVPAAATVIDVTGRPAAPCGQRPRRGSWPTARASVAVGNAVRRKASWLQSLNCTRLSGGVRMSTPCVATAAWRRACSGDSPRIIAVARAGLRPAWMAAAASSTGSWTSRSSSWRMTPNAVHGNRTTTPTRPPPRARRPRWHAQASAAGHDAHPNRPPSRAPGRHRDRLAELPRDVVSG